MTNLPVDEEFEDETESPVAPDLEAADEDGHDYEAPEKDDD